MPHALTDRQREYLEFVREYVRRNESSPRLDEIAEHFGVQPPTVHRMLEALQRKGYLYFGRTSHSGFFIRLIERAGSAETVIEIAIAGKVDRFGEVYDFPSMLSHFATLLLGAKPDEVFALVVMEDIPQASMLAQDLIIFDMGKRPQPGDICIGPIGERLFLIRVASKTLDRRTFSLETAQQYPIPENLIDEKFGQRLNWHPLAYDDETADFFERVAEEQDWPIGSLPRDLIAATALRLSRALAF